MDTLFIVIGGLLLVSQLVVLVSIRHILGVIAANQVRTTTQAAEIVTETAKTLARADAQRQTRDPGTGDSAVNIKQQ